jgi:hypothetical protein
MNPKAPRKNAAKACVYFTIIGIVGLLAYLFLCGKLFAYSPIKIGFAKNELSNVVVYVQEGAEFHDFATIDSYIPAVEKSHAMHFVTKPAVLFFGDKDSYLRKVMTKARFMAYPNGSVVVSPWALQESRNGTISMEIYLKHELSHILLDQQMGVLAAYIYFPRWLLEGVAVYKTNQFGTSWYPSKEETYASIKQGNFLPPSFYATAKEDEVPLNVKYPIAFVYSEFGCIVDYLVTSYGEEKLQEYLRELFHESNHDKVFKHVYGRDFNDFLAGFKQHAQEIAP